MSEPEEFEPSLENLVGQESLKWVFVGGKGGVGKTTCSSSLAVQLAQHRSSVLILSTDPAHNLSDAFSQKFSSEPTLVNGFDNLHAMEIDTSVPLDENAAGLDKGFMHELIGAIPGVDEAISFAEMMREVQSMKFDVIVFDTAPTGHTLRLLQFPQILDTCLEKLMSLGDRFSPMISQAQQMATMFGMNLGEVSADDILEKVDAMKRLVEEVLRQFKNPELTTFVCVCIPEFLSLYETERLVQELTKCDIETRNIIVNQILIPEPDCNSNLLKTRAKMQNKYLDQMEQLYGEDFHVTRLPLLANEIRGPTLLKPFSKMLVDPTIVGEHRHWSILDQDQ